MARRGGVAVQLSPKEFDLLEFFMRHPGHLLSRERILSEIWGEESGERANVLQVYVGYLREKIDRPLALTRSRQCAASATA